MMSRFYFLFLLFFIAKLSACTDFIIGTKSNQFVVGRSMEFGIDLNSNILFFPKGKDVKTTVQNRKAHQWKQKYDYVGFDAFNMGFVVDGLNEKGLSFEALWFDGAIYPKVNLNRIENVVPLMDFGNWILGAFATVDDVKKALQTIELFPDKVPKLGGIPPLHFSVHDKSGRSIVIEFIDGKMQIDNNIIGVLTNTPKFDWHVTNLGNYLNLSVMNTGPTKFDGTVLNPTGQGGGFLGIPGDWTPPSRFVRIAVFKGHAIKPNTIDQGVNLAFHLLNTVDIPYGLIEERNGKSYDYTQWAIAKDLSQGKVYYRTYKNLNIRSVEISKLAKGGFQKIPME